MQLLGVTPAFNSLYEIPKGCGVAYMCNGRLAFNSLYEIPGDVGTDGVFVIEVDFQFSLWDSR